MIEICSVMYTWSLRILYIHLHSPTMVVENKNCHITHIKQHLTKHRLNIKVTKKISLVTSGINYDLPRLKHLHNKF